MDRLKDSELLSTTDGQVWAQQFNLIFAELHEGTTLDEGWLIGWFANAIETGRAAGQRQSLESVRSEARNAGLDEAAKICEFSNTEHGRYFAKAIRDRALSPARVAEGEAVYCHECSKAGGADRAIYHEPPACTPESPAKEQPGEQIIAGDQLAEPHPCPCRFDGLGMLLKDTECFYHAKQGWVPVSERLPERAGETLVADKFDRVEVACWDDSPISGKRECRWPNVTHWMPLPSPPGASDE
jgi:hypothetical protein